MEVKFPTTSHPVSTAQRLPSKNTARMGDEGKAVGWLSADGFAYLNHCRLSRPPLPAARATYYFSILIVRVVVSPAGLASIGHVAELRI